MAADIRVELETLMRATLSDEAAHHNWTYKEVRPMPMPTKERKYVHGITVNGDCSKGCQYLCWWTPGCPDPMGNNFAEWGNSQTLWLKLQHVDNPSKLDVGDIVTFGNDGDQHAAMVLETGNDPVLWSFGHQGAPNTYKLSQDSREKQFLKMPIPTYVKTPADRLRARTGWFAWVAWRLGEGDWGHYQPAEKDVRPNVPKVIPPVWWVRYSKFLLNRKKGNSPTNT